MFLECPDTGVGTGVGKIKVGEVQQHIHLFLIL